MEFTYAAYRDMLRLLKEHRYAFCRYSDYESAARCVILRHDIDQSIDKAVTLAELEAAEGVPSTWFVLLRTDFYNPASRASLDGIRALLAMGHDVGLHFDEVAADPKLPVADAIRQEAAILSDICGAPITSVSMHRPSRATLDADLVIPGMINSYGKTFFQSFKYVSDSCRNWREPVEEIIRSEAYDRLHILTHAFWYNEEETDLRGAVTEFVRAASGERYENLKANIRDLESVVTPDEI